MTGRTLGHHQILEKLGAGGMGEVYKARDTRLNRMVAIKVLPPQKIADPARKRRFIQEAQAASALQHPNIVVIHDINCESGIDYMVMEYIEGKTLDALTPRQGMALGEVLKIAIPIADGLAKAHSAGIVHRDIKPSNLMVATDGRVKILDFGLAKLSEAAELEPGDATLTARPGTEDGTILGTVHYMSPEQTEGRKLDARSDIFSFGAVLYEMVSGRRAFAGESKVAALSAILKDEPAMPEGIAPEMERILRRALRKDVAKRFQHMDDLRVALDELREESESGRLTAIEPPGRRRKRTWLPWATASSVAIAAVVGFLWMSNRPAAAPGPEMRLKPITADSGLTTTPAISPDGRMIAYASDRGTDGNLDIWVHPLAAGAAPIRLTKAPADDWDPSFSKDGGMIAFRSERSGGGIYLIPALGGEERLLASGGWEPRFSPDGNWIAYSTGSNFLMDSQVFVIPPSGGTPRRIAPELGWVGTPAWTESGDLLVRGMNTTNNFESAEYWVASVDGSKARRTDIASKLGSKRLGTRALFAANGDLLFAARNGVWSAPFDVRSGRMGEPRSLATATSTLRDARGNSRHFVVATDVTTFHLWKLPVELESGKVRGPIERLADSGGEQMQPALSGDGQVLAYTQLSPSGNEIRIRDLGTGKDRMLLGQYGRPKVSPDGIRIAFSPSARGLSLMNASGGQVDTLSSESLTLYGWTADGHDLIFWEGSPTRFGRFHLRTRTKSPLISHPKYNIHGAELSADGKWIAFAVPDRLADRDTMYVAPVRDGVAAPENEWIAVESSAGANGRPWWALSGNLLYSVSSRDQFSCIWAQRLNATSKKPEGEPFAVMHFHEARRPLSSGAPIGPGISRRHLILGIADRTGNVWMSESSNN